MTLADIQNYIYFRTRTNSTSFPNADMIILINNALERVETIIRNYISEYNFTRFTASDLSTGTAVPKFHSRFHEIIPLWVSYKYAVSQVYRNSNQLGEELRLLEDEMRRWYGQRNYRIFTVTIASPGVFTLKKHGLFADDRVIFETSGALPTGLSADTWYYVISDGLDEDEFQVSTTKDGDAINTTGSQSGTHFLASDKQKGIRAKQEDNR